MRDNTQFGFDPEKVYTNLGNGHTLSGKDVNEILSYATNPEEEAIILLSFVEQLQRSEPHNNANSGEFRDAPQF